MRRSGGKGSRQGLEAVCGFTLIELIVVIALISIFLSLGVPSLREGIYADPLKSAARKLIGTVRNVRQLAAEERQPYIVVIDRGEKAFWFREADVAEEDIEEEGKQAFPDGIEIGEITVEGQEEKEIDQISIWVSEQGYVNRTRLQLADDSGDTIYLDFYPFIVEAGVSDSADEIFE